MVVEELIGVSAGLIKEIGQITLWLQAIGIIGALWIVFQSVSLFLNRKRMKEVYAIHKDMERIEGKIDKILAKKK